MLFFLLHHFGFYHLVCNQSAVHRSFAVTDNLGEVSAKAQVRYIPYENTDHKLFASITFIHSTIHFMQIQSVCFDNLGLVLAAFLNFLTKNDQRFCSSLSFRFHFYFSSLSCKYSEIITSCLFYRLHYLVQLT